MAEEGAIASQAFFDSNGNPRASPEQVITTPSVIGLMAFFFALSLGLAFGIGWYWHEIELAKKVHPDEVGYGHWYFAKFFRVLFTIIASIVLLAIWVLASLAIFVFPGPVWAQAYRKGKEQGQEDKTLNALEQNVIAGANVRTTRFRQTRYGDAGGQELKEM